jgi:hypothetical protein
MAEAAKEQPCRHAAAVARQVPHDGKRKRPPRQGRAMSLYRRCSHGISVSYAAMVSGWA